MDDHFKELEQIGQEASLWLDNDSGTPEERFFELQLLFNRLIELKGRASLPPDWAAYLEGVESSLHQGIASVRGEIPQKVATQLNIKVQAEQARHRYSEAEMSRELRDRLKNRKKLILLASVLAVFVLLLSGGIGWYQWTLFMANEGWFHDIRNERWGPVDRRIGLGKSIETRDASGRTALLMAAGAGNPDTFEALIERGADIHATDSRGQGVLHYAAASESPALVARLLEAGLDPSASDDSGTTPLHTLFRQGPGSRESMEIMHLLLDAGAEAKAADEDESVLMAAVLWVRGAYYERPLEVLEELIRNGADPNYENANGATPLSHALAKYLPDQPDPGRISEIDPVIALLLEAGANPDKDEVTVGREESELDQGQLQFLPSLR